MARSDLSNPVTHAMHAARTAVHASATAEDARTALRERRLDHFLFYVYVVDEHDRLLGQVSARRLLLSRGDERITELMHQPAALVGMHESVGQAFEALSRYRLLSLPVVDHQGRLLGVVDITAWTAASADRNESSNHESFSRIGAAVEEHRLGSPIRGFRLRMPWLLCNVASGVVCAMIAEANKQLLEQVVLLAAFIPLVLTVSESVGVQAAELSVRLLQADPSPAAFHRRLLRESITALALGACTGTIVALISLVFGNPAEHRAMFAILLCSVTASMLSAGMIGTIAPRIMRGTGADPRFASGPITLMAVDVACTLTYLSIAGVLLKRFLLP